MLKYLLSILIVAVLASCVHKKQVEAANSLNPIYDKAYDLNDSGVLDSAFLYFNKAKDVFSQQDDRLGIGKCLLNMALISTIKGDHFGAQELSLDAIAYFNSKHSNQHIYIQSNYNNLGITAYNLGDFSKAIEFYTKAKTYTTDSATFQIIENNIANVYRRSGNLTKALATYKDILSLYKVKDPLSNEGEAFARTLTNYAYTKWLQNRRYDPSSELYQALAIRQKRKDQSGLISSYAFLSDYFSAIQPNKAAGYAEIMYQLAKQINNPNDQLEALQRLIKLRPEKQSKKYFEVHQNLADSLQIIRNAAKNQFALIRYESEKSKADNLRLQKENSEKTYQVNQQKTVTFFILLVMLVAGIATYDFQKKRRQRMELTALNKIKESRLKTSKKVHDVVANGLYKVMTEIENQSGISKDEILDRLDNMYQQSRDISYEVEELPSVSYHYKINKILKAFESEHTRINIKGNSADTWLNASPQILNDIMHILQEFMVNMDKHSLATCVTLNFKQHNKRIDIIYSDNGIGMSEHMTFNNGLNSTGNRIKNMNGEFNFDTKIKKGLQIKLSIPLS